MNDFIAIDFETADLSADSAISVGLVKYRDYKPLASYYSLIKPPVPYIRPDFTELHGLTMDDVKDAPDFKYIWENEIRGFFTAVPFAAHNADFDMKVLSALLHLYEIPVPQIMYFCTLKLSRRLWPDLRSHSLANLAKTFNIIYDAHNAVADADTCAKIVVLGAQAVAQKSKRKNIIGLESLLKKTGTAMLEL
ncbi:MAG: 3'-5' exonuclease [Treponema sp.]|nr:3'-5' exonuclease [Treponema sp.]